MIKMFLSTVLGLIGLTIEAPLCASFSVQHGPHPLGRIRSSKSTSVPFRKSVDDRHHRSKLFMANQFDVSKPVFDPLSLRNVRGDAIIRYDATNQSEPLRIILFALFGVTSLSSPFLVEAIGYEPFNTLSTIGAVGLAAGSGALFVKECTSRARQLSRIEKELNTESLPIRLPTNPFSEVPFTKAVPLKALRGVSKPPRIIAICGNQEKITQALSSLAVYRNRLTQASVLVVAISTDGSKSKDWQVLDSTSYKSWLADPNQSDIWLDYFRSLTSDESSDDFDFRWFGLNANGRSFGSGDGEIQIIQLMGQFLRPIDFLDPSDDESGKTFDSDKQAEKEILETVESFYHALTTGDQDTIERIYSSSNSKEVSEVRTV
mmetsp:Transcript_7649/g.15739  ORF Transcript_7649/g.15739 Transcript_7649/m.15739 type:complete len:376 (-) Transcript_7649:17-1144(-)